MTEVKSIRDKGFGWISSLRYEHLLAGLSGGAVSTLILHPLDLLKIRFAVSPNHKPSYGGIKRAVKTIVVEDGIRGLYNGMSPNIVGAGAAWGFYFFFYNQGKSFFQAGDRNKQLAASTHLLTASMAGVLTLTMTNPIWVVKTRLILQSNSSNTGTIKYTGLTDALIKIGRTEGIRGLYSGFIPGLFGVSHGAIQFMAYEDLKNRYLNHYNLSITTKLGNTEYLLFAALSKFIAAFTTYPYQVVRARLQDQEKKYSGSLDCISKTFRGEGFGGFYKGLVPNLLRVVPATMITFVVYENLSHFLLNRRSEEKVTGVLDITKKSS